MSRPIEDAYLEAALEEKFSASPTDLTDSIMAAARQRDPHGDYPSVPAHNPWLRRLLIAGVILLGLAVIPAIRLLQDAPTNVTATDVDAPVRQLVEPRSAQELLELLKEVRSVSIQVRVANGVPMQVAGEAPPPELPLLGPGSYEKYLTAVRDLVTADTEVGHMVDGQSVLDDMLATMLTELRGVAEAGTFGETQARRDHVLRLYLTDGRHVEVARVESRGLAGLTSNWIQVRGLGLAPLDRELDAVLTTLVSAGNTTTAMVRGVFSAEDPMAEKYLDANRRGHVRLHDATPAQLAKFATARTNMRSLDLRWSPAVHSRAGMLALSQSPSVERVILTGAASLGNDALKTLPGTLRELLLCDLDRDPSGFVGADTSARSLHADVLKGLAGLPLRELSLPGLRGLGSFVGKLSMPNLERLSVGNAAGRPLMLLGYIDMPALRRLDAAGGQVGDSELGMLLRVPELVHLDVSRPRADSVAGLSPNAWRTIAKRKTLQTVILGGWLVDGVQGDPADWNAALSAIAALPDLRHLDLSHSPALTPGALDVLSAAKNLRRLDLRHCPRVGPHAVATLRQRLPDCEILFGDELLAMRLLATDEPPRAGVRFELEKEKQRLLAWLDRDDHRARVIAEPTFVQEFSGSEPGPLDPQTLRWVPHVIRPQSGKAGAWAYTLTFGGNTKKGVVPLFDPATWPKREAGAPDYLVELVAVDFDSTCFRGSDLEPDSIRATVDGSGRPAVGYRMRPEKASAYADWSEANIDKHVAIIVDGVIVSVPRFIGRIAGSGMIQGAFDEGAARVLAERLRGQ